MTGKSQPSGGEPKQGDDAPIGKRRVHENGLVCGFDMCVVDPLALSPRLSVGRVLGVPVRRTTHRVRARSCLVEIASPRTPAETVRGTFTCSFSAWTSTVRGPCELGTEVMHLHETSSSFEVGPQMPGAAAASVPQAFPTTSAHMTTPRVDRSNGPHAPFNEEGETNR